MNTITVGTGTCGTSAGAESVVNQFKELIARSNRKDISLKETGCIGMCYREVLVEIADDKGGKYLYGSIDVEKAKLLFNEHLLQGKVVDDLMAMDSTGLGPESDFLSKQHRIVLKNAGRIDPLSLEDYLAHGGHQALSKALKQMKPDEIIAEIKDSGLRGRGGAGFPTGLKWEFASKSISDEKYVICNADEGDPGAFMDRSVLESDPHAVLEGMIICGRAIGAHKGYIYCRAEYPKAIARLKVALALAREQGYLGKNILGTDFAFDILIKEGAGAFVCGEETALIASIEGKRGTPGVRPPYPVSKGLWKKPTNINNVETLASIAWIIQNGAQAFNKIGTESSKGTKVFAMAGKVKRSGLVEVPMGMTINELIYQVCDGTKSGKKYKAVQMGGPSGGCIPARLGETRIDYQEITATGAIMGSGGMIVVDDSTCMVELARFFLQFTQNESCGKCVSCRVGTLRMLEILERIVAGKGKIEDLQRLEEMSEHIKQTSQCGLGQTAPNPVLTTMKYFRDEYEAHINNKKCPAHDCQALVNFIINSDKCTGCMACLKQCPVEAISGERKKVHKIDQQKCIKCGKCITTCNFDAIFKD